MQKIMGFVLLWMASGMSARRAALSIGIAKDTVLQWPSYCRRTVAKALEMSQYKFIVTEESPVQADESFFSERRKNGRGWNMHGDVVKEGSEDNRNSDETVLELSEWYSEDTPEEAGEDDEEHVDF